jgi:hypothetical protein
LRLCEQLIKTTPFDTLPLEIEGLAVEIPTVGLVMFNPAPIHSPH